MKSEILTTRGVPVLLAGAVLFLLLSIYRENIIPFGADEARRSALLTGDEPTYLLMAQSIARGHGLNVRSVNEDEAWRIFQQRPVLHPDQWTWDHYFGGWLSPVTDQSGAWGNAQKPPFAPLLSVMLAPIIPHTQSIRWWNALIQGILLTATAMILACFFYHESKGRLWTSLFASVAGFGSIPVAYYTAQVFPEILASICILLFLLLYSSAVDWKKAFAAALLCLSLWATPRVAPAIAVASVFILWDFIKCKSWPPLLVMVLGIPAFILFNLYVWSSWLPPMGGSFLRHFLGDVFTWEFAVRVYGGSTRFFWANDVGLLFFSPLMFVGCVSLLLNCFLCRTKQDLLVAALVAISVITTGLYDDYRAGTCPAGRYQVIVGCILIYSLISSIHRLPPYVLRRMLPATVLLGLLSLTIGVLVSQSPHYWYRQYHPLFGYMQIQQLYRWLPSFDTGIPNRYMFIWCMIFIIPFSAYDLGIFISTKMRRLMRKRTEIQ
jgi:hypothetical protein